MADYVAGRGTTALGIIGTVLGSLGVAGNGGFGLFNNGAMCHENTPVNRYELGQEQKIADLVVNMVPKFVPNGHFGCNY